MRQKAVHLWLVHCSMLHFSRRSERCLTALILPLCVIQNVTLDSLTQLMFHAFCSAGGLSTRTAPPPFPTLNFYTFNFFFLHQNKTFLGHSGMTIKVVKHVWRYKLLDKHIFILGKKSPWLCPPVQQDSQNKREQTGKSVMATWIKRAAVWKKHRKNKTFRRKLKSGFHVVRQKRWIYVNPSISPLTYVHRWVVNSYNYLDNFLGKKN